MKPSVSIVLPHSDESLYDSPLEARICWLDGADQQRAAAAA
jgi:hypothetical protein